MVKCCVDGCKITSKKDVTYFKFPASRSLRQKWEAALKISGRKLNGASVCSRHFTAGDYDLVRGKMRLKAAVVPTVLAIEVKSNSITNNIPTNEDITDETKDLSPEREKERDPDEDITESNDSPMNHTSPKGPTLDPDKPSNKDVSPTRTKSNDSPMNHTSEDPTLDPDKPSSKDVSPTRTESNDSPMNHTSVDPTLDPDKPSNKDVSPTRESSPQKDRLTNEETTVETDKIIDKDMSPVNDTTKTNGVTETVEKDLSKDKLDPEKDISKDKIDGDVKDSCETNISNNLDSSSSSSKTSDINKDLSANEKEDSKKGENEAKTTETIDNKNADDSLDENQDIEELLTDYRIYQNNIHKVENEITVEIEPENDMETYDGDLPHNADPVFIELAVDKESANDCLMVLESVQVEIDPSTLLEHQEFEVASDDLDGDDDEVSELKESQGPKEPISLLTSSDEDDVIIEEPKIDTVEVSDETDEDDKPLVQLVKKKKKKKKVKRKRAASEDEFKRIMWGMYEYFCVECHFRTHNKSEYNKHRLQHTKVLLMCQLCGYMTSSESQLSKHEKQHKDFKRYQCHLCEYKAKHNMSLVYHMRSHKEGNKCYKCNYLTVSQSEFVRHVMLCKGVGGKRHCCDKCDYRTSKPSDLKRHKARKHKDSDSEDEYVP